MQRRNSVPKTRTERSTASPHVSSLFMSKRSLKKYITDFSEYLISCFMFYTLL